MKPIRTRRLALPAAVAVALGLSTLAPGAHAAAPGALDTTFGGTGVIELPAGTTARDAVVQADGKLVVVGSSGGLRKSRMLVTRLNVDGTLDPTFGAVSVPLSGARRTTGNAIALTRDGRIVVAGDRFSASGADGMFVARLTADGKLDPTFGKSGVASLNRGRKAGGANDVAVRRNGTIVLGGSAIGKGPEAVATIAQLTAGGKPGPTSRHYEVGAGEIQGITLQPDGKVVFVGMRRNDQTIEAIVGRARTNGTIDKTFGGGVRARSYAKRAASSGLRDVARLPNGSIVATGYAFTGTGAGMRQITARFTKSGSPQRGFGSNGVVYTRAAKSSSISTTPPGGGAALALKGSQVYLGGSWDERAISALSVQLQSAGGSLVRPFGVAGRTNTPIRSYNEPAYGSGLALGASGLHLVGTAGRVNSEDTFGVIARYGA